MPTRVKNREELLFKLSEIINWWCEQNEGLHAPMSSDEEQQALEIQLDELLALTI